VQALDAAGFAVGVVNPRRIKAFREAEGKRAKTDRLDAGLIARFALVMTDALRPLPSAEQRALKALATRRRQLTEMIAMEKTRLKQALEPAVAESHRAAIADLSRACHKIEVLIETALAKDPRQAQDRRILTSIPGIGPRIAQVLLTEMPELGHCDRKAIASLAGLAPHISQSGQAPPRAAIAGGRPCIRTALYMSALVAVRHDPKMKRAYQALRASGKPAKLALIAMARRILVTANAMIKAQTLYNPDTNPT
jgi:transposase